MIKTEDIFWTIFPHNLLTKQLTIKAFGVKVIKNSVDTYYDIHIKTKQPIKRIQGGMNEMTDLKLNLKAGNLKRILAMFMAVCLTVLSVNVPVFAEEVKHTDQTSKAGEVTVTLSGNVVVSSANGESVSYNKLTVSVNEVFIGSDKVTDLDAVEAIAKEVKIKDDKFVDAPTISENVVSGSVAVQYPENKETAERVIKATVSAELVGLGEDGKDFVVEQDVVITQAAAAKAPNGLELGTEVVSDPNGWMIVDPEGNDADGKGYYDEKMDAVVEGTVDDKGNVVSSINGTAGNPKNDSTAAPDDYRTIEADKALDKDAYAGDLNNIEVSKLNGTGKDALKNAENLVTVKVYDGIATKKAPLGSVVAVYSVKKGDTVQATTKVNALKTNYYEGKTLTGFVSVEPTFKKTKITGVDITKGVPYVFGTTPADKDMYVMAQYGEAENAVTGLNGTITIQSNKSATIQISLPADKKADVKKVAADIGDSKVLKSVKYNAKTATLTFKAAKVAGDSTTNVTVTFQDKKGTAVDVPKATYTVKVQTAPVAYTNGLHLSTADGFVGITLDKTSASKTAQLVATPGTTGVKYVAVNCKDDKTLSAIAGTSVGNLSSKDAKNRVKLGKGEKAKAVSVSKTGLVTAKKVALDGVNVYAIQTVKDGKNYTVTVSNAVTVAVKATMTEKGFSFNGGKKFTYKAAGTKIKGDVVTGYNAKKATPVKFTVKVKGESTDRVAVRVMNNEGRVVLNALNRVQNTKKPDVEMNSYYTTVHQGKGYASTGGVSYFAKDTLTVIATSPVGEQYYKQLRFEEK